MEEVFLQPYDLALDRNGDKKDHHRFQLHQGSRFEGCNCGGHLGENSRLCLFCRPSRQPRFYIIVDEAHRLAYEESALDLIAREGREYGVGLIVASQFFKDFKKEVAGNLSSIISYHVQPSEEARYVAQQLGDLADLRITC